MVYSSRKWFVIDSNKQWILKRKFLFIEKVILLLILGICWFKMMFYLPFIVTFFNIIVLISSIVLLQEIIVIIFEKKASKRRGNR